MGSCLTYAAPTVTASQEKSSKGHRIKKWFKCAFTSNSQYEYISPHIPAHDTSCMLDSTEQPQNDLYELKPSTSRPYPRDTSSSSPSSASSLSRLNSSRKYGSHIPYDMSGRSIGSHSRRKTQHQEAHYRGENRQIRSHYHKSRAYSLSLSTPEPKSTPEEDWERGWDIPLAYRTGFGKAIYQTKEKGLQIRNKESILRLRGNEQLNAEAEMLKGSWLREDGTGKLRGVWEEEIEAAFRGEFDENEELLLETPLRVSGRPVGGAIPKRTSFKRYRRASLRTGNAVTYDRL